MLELMIAPVRRRATRILCIGAHCDDIEIGCGGTLLKLLARGSCDVTWVVFSSSPQRAAELRVSSRLFLRRAHHSHLVSYEFRDSYFPGDYTTIKDTFGQLRSLPDPDLVFTHHHADRHQDHRLLSELTGNLFRRHLVLEYEIPKLEGGLTTPNAYVQLTRAQVNAKVRALLKSYPSQRRRPWFRAETFEALMRLRGVEAGAGTGWAEGFHAAKINIG